MLEEKIVLLKLNDKRDVFTTVPKSMSNEVKKSISSEFRQGTRDTIRGLNPIQERLYLPNVLGVSKDDPSFPLKARDFWSDFTITPTPEGIRLNVATTTSRIKTTKEVNGETIADEVDVETPVDWDSYVIWQFALKSSRVAVTKDQLDNLEMYDFYMVNLAEVQEKEEKEFQVQDKAAGYYVRLTADSKWEQNEDKINWILEVMRDKRTSFSPNMTRTEKKMQLAKHRDNSPALFISIYDDENLEHKAFVTKAVTAMVLKKEGNFYFNHDENIGSDETVVSWFKNPANSGKLLQLKARLEKVLQDKKQ